MYTVLWEQIDSSLGPLSISPHQSNANRFTSELVVTHFMFTGNAFGNEKACHIIPGNRRLVSFMTTVLF